jgi:hypothetical protein
VRYAGPGIFDHGGGFAGSGLPDEVPIIARRGELMVPPERIDCELRHIEDCLMKLNSLPLKRLDCWSWCWCLPYQSRATAWVQEAKMLERIATTPGTAGVVLLILGQSSSVLAIGATPVPTDPTWSSANWRPVSGYTGDDSVFYTASSSRHALNQLRFYEHSDDPMLIEIWEEKLCDDRPCDPGPRNTELRASDRDHNENTRKILSAGDDHYITAIQVCTTNDNDTRKRKIKGARIWTARLEPGGIVKRTNYEPREFARPNCNNHWRDKQLCLGNRLAIGLRAYYHDDWEDGFYFTGLELQCADVNG